MPPRTDIDFMRLALEQATAAQANGEVPVGAVLVRGDEVVAVGANRPIARVLAQMDGKNPDSWADVRLELPRLAEARWFQKVKRGYARGWEPVQFVDRVQRYLTLLEWQPGEGVASQATRVQVGFSTGG